METRARRRREKVREIELKKIENVNAEFMSEMPLDNPNPNPNPNPNQHNPNPNPNPERSKNKRKSNFSKLEKERVEIHTPFIELHTPFIEHLSIKTLRRFLKYTLRSVALVSVLVLGSISCYSGYMLARAAYCVFYEKPLGMFFLVTTTSVCLTITVSRGENNHPCWDLSNI